MGGVFWGRFGDAGQALVLEERTSGPEVSVFALSDGERLVLLPTAQDHKRIGEGDTGPNTGGRGAYAPAPLLDAAGLAEVQRTIPEPHLAALKARGIGLQVGHKPSPGGCPAPFPGRMLSVVWSDGRLRTSLPFCADAVVRLLPGSAAVALLIQLTTLLRVMGPANAGKLRPLRVRAPLAKPSVLLIKVLLVSDAAVFKGT